MSQSSKVVRKLAAIVFTDIVGYTKLSAENEPDALKLLETQRKLIKPIVEAHNGEWLKEIGDGLLLCFSTNHDAVNCSIDIQEKAKLVRNLRLRIGIHQGEVTLRDGDVLGDDVNVASRIESYSPIGGIAISGKVQQDISSLPEYKTKFIELTDLICVSAPVGIFLGRISNFINGELYGRPSSTLFGIIFPTADNQYRHPSQLYEAFLEGLILFIVLNISIFFFKTYGSIELRSNSLTIGKITRDLSNNQATQRSLHDRPSKKTTSRKRSALRPCLPGYHARRCGTDGPIGISFRLDRPGTRHHISDRGH